MDKIRLLIVDDEAEVAEILSLRLSRRGFDTSAVFSGQECLDFLNKQTVDIVMLDVKMPGIGGLEVLDAITLEHPSIAVIMLSGHVDPEAAMDGISRGAFCYELKPIDIDTICNKIEDAVRQKALEKQLKP